MNVTQNNKKFSLLCVESERLDTREQISHPRGLYMNNMIHSDYFIAVKDLLNSLGLSWVWDQQENLKISPDLNTRLADVYLTYVYTNGSLNCMKSIQIGIKEL